MVNGTKIHKYLDHPYWIPKCLNIGQISIPLQIFSYIYFPQIFTEIGFLCEIKIMIFSIDPNVKGAISESFDKSHLSESVDVPAG